MYPVIWKKRPKAKKTKKLLLVWQLSIVEKNIKHVIMFNILGSKIRYNLQTDKASDTNINYLKPNIFKISILLCTWVCAFLSLLSALLLKFLSFWRKLDDRATTAVRFRQRNAHLKCKIIFQRQSDRHLDFESKQAHAMCWLRPIPTHNQAG